MSGYNNSSPDCTRWTNARLIDEARRLSELSGFGHFFRDQPVILGVQEDSGPFIREETRLYRETWLNPILDEIDARLTKRARR